MNHQTSNLLFKAPRLLLIGVIRFYQVVISPVKNMLFGPGGSCRFQPTCSQYAIDSLKAHGAFKGFWKTLVRLAKCHPFHPGGYDPVKPATSHYQTVNRPDSLLDL